MDDEQRAREREEFETTILRENGGNHIALMQSRDGEYTTPSTYYKWIGWAMRAEHADGVEPCRYPACACPNRPSDGMPDCNGAKRALGVNTIEAPRLPASVPPCPDTEDVREWWHGRMSAARSRWIEDAMGLAYDYAQALQWKAKTGEATDAEQKLLSHLQQVQAREAPHGVKGDGDAR